jgi:hypothetical protein
MCPTGTDCSDCQPLLFAGTPVRFDRVRLLRNGRYRIWSDDIQRLQRSRC